MYGETESMSLTPSNGSGSSVDSAITSSFSRIHALSVKLSFFAAACITFCSSFVTRMTSNTERLSDVFLRGLPMCLMYNIYKQSQVRGTAFR